MRAYLKNQMIETSIASPVKAAAASLGAWFASMGLQHVQAGLGVAASIVAIGAGIFSFLLGFEKWRAMRRRRRFDEAKCRAACLDPGCASAKCRIAQILGQAASDD